MSALNSAKKRQFEVDEIVTIKGFNESDLYYGKIKKIHDDNIYYDVELIQTNKIKRRLNVDRVEKVALIQYIAYIREKGNPPRSAGYLIQYAKENNGIDVKYVDARDIIKSKPDITNYNRIPPSLLQKKKKGIDSEQHPLPNIGSAEEKREESKESEKPQSVQEIMLKLIYEAIETNRHKSPLLSKTLGIEGISIWIHLC